MILFMWLGGALLLLGVVLVLWPEPVHPVFAAARRKRRGGTSAQPGVVGQRGAGCFERVLPLELTRRMLR